MCSCDTDADGVSTCVVDLSGASGCAVAPAGQTDPSLAEIQRRAEGIRNTLLILAGVSAAVSAYHGYKRNEGSAGYALAWGVSGFVFPVITPVVAVVQGYAEPHRAPT